MSEPTIVYFKSLNRPSLMMGVDRRFCILNAGISFLIALTSMFDWRCDILAVFFFLLVHAALVLMARIDALFYDLYCRHRRYPSYYRAQPTVHSVLPLRYPSVPVYQGQRGIV
jgi:type IV secretory pathway TrbD component